MSLDRLFVFALFSYVSARHLSRSPNDPETAKPSTDLQEALGIRQLAVVGSQWLCGVHVQ